MTLGTMLSDLYRRLGFAASPDTSVTTRLTAFLNESHHDILGRPGMDRLRRSSLTFASVASQSQYAMPPIVGRVRAVIDPTNDINLGGRDWGWYRDTEPDPSSETGTPQAFIPYGIAAVSKQPSNASKIYVDSTAAGDTNTAYVEGFRTGGYPFSWSGLMTGATAVQVGAYTDIIEITKFYLSAAAVGDVTLNEDAEGGTELGKIPIGSTFARFWVVALWPTPSAAITYTIDCDRIVPEMSATNDQPLLPDDFHRVLLAGARMREYEKQDDTRLSVAKAEYEQGIRELRWWCSAQPTVIVSTRQAAPASRLGAWYPAGT